MLDPLGPQGGLAISSSWNALPEIFRELTFSYVLLRFHYLFKEALPVYPLLKRERKKEKSTPTLLPSFIFHNSTYHLHIIYLIIYLYPDCLIWQWLCLFYSLLYSQCLEEA